MTGERGFTLVEVLIALTVFATIMALALGGFRFSATAWQTGIQAVDSSEEIHAVRRVLNDWVGTAIVQLSSRDSTASLAAGFSGDGDSLSFATHRPPYPSQGGLYRVRLDLFYDAVRDKTLLRARITIADQDAADDWEDLAVLPGQWQFTYFKISEPERWTPDWTAQDQMPAVVRLAPQATPSSWPSFHVAPLAKEPFVCVSRALDPNRSIPAACRRS